MIEDSTLKNVKLAISNDKKMTTRCTLHKLNTKEIRNVMHVSPEVIVIKHTSPFVKQHPLFSQIRTIYHGTKCNLETFAVSIWQCSPVLSFRIFS